MDKHLLFLFLVLIGLDVYPQNGKQSKPSYSVIEIISPNFNVPPSQNTFSVPVIKTKPAINSNAKTAVVTANLFTGSMDVFAYTISQSNPLQYNPSINAVSFIARKSSTYTAATNNNSSAIVGLYSTNFGATWNETCLRTNSTQLTRYVQGGIFNPSGNTNINNAYMVACGPITTATTGAAWDGNWYASKPLAGGGTTTPGIDQQSFLDSSPTLKKHAMSRYSFTAIDGGLCRSLGMIVNDVNASNNVAYGLRGPALVKGQFNAGSFVWSVDSLFIVPVNTKPFDGTKLLKDFAVQAWSENGNIGYVVMIGSRSGTGPSMIGMQPIVYITTNGGVTWSLLPANDFTDPVFFSGVNKRIYASASNTNVICANFTGSEGFDATVDVNGQLHIATTVIGHSSNHLDSLNYRYAFGPEQYSYSHQGPFEHPTIYDFYLKASGGWGYLIVDSMGTEGPSGFIAQPGYTTNPWTLGTQKLGLDSRIQVSRTADGKKIFYSWTESDSTFVGKKWNIYPDIKMKGFDVMANKVTPRINITSGVTNADKLSYFHYMSNTSAGSSSACVTVPYTITYNSTKNGQASVDTYYLDGIQICPSGFGISVDIKTEEVFNFNVSNYPNPANDATTIVVGLKEDSNFEVVIYNSIGQVVGAYKLNGHIGSNEINVDLSNFRSGVYFYTIKVGGSVVTKKLVVQ